MAFYYREDTSLIQLTVKNGKQGELLSNQQCVSIEGGEAEAATEHVFPGNMETSAPIGGIVTPGDVTVELLYTDSIAPKTQALKEAAKWASEVSATVTPLNAEATPEEGELTWKGVLKSVAPPKRDASSSGKTMVKIVFTAAGD
jgi:hypothetical protein